MQIRIVSVAKVKQSFVLEGEAEYLKRLRPWAQIEVQELGIKGNWPESEVRRRESEAFLAKLALKTGELLILLDENGKEHTSAGFSKWLTERQLHGTSSVCFALGGAYGWDLSVFGSKVQRMSLSKLTMPYQLCRLLLVEQLYRAFSLMNNSPYHKA